MAQEERGELIVGLDIGTTKICAVVGEVRDRDSRVHPATRAAGAVLPRYDL